MTLREVSLRPTRPPAFERLQRELGLPRGDDFGTARQLVALVEAAAPLLNTLDRIQISRLMYGAAHSISQYDKRSDR